MKKIILAALCTLSTAFAFAAENPNLQPLGFDDVKAACQNPAKFHNQVAPASIQVSCRDIQYKWVPSDDGAINLPTAHLVTTSVMSDKYSVAPTSAEVASSPQVIACAQYKQVAETVETVRAVACDEMVAFSGTAIDYCAAAATSMRSANKAAIQTADTGKTMSLCAGSGETKGKEVRP